MRLPPFVQEKLAEILPANSLRRRFAKGAFWSISGTAISQALALAASIVTARILGKVGFGELGMIVSTVGMFGIFAGLGLGLTATKHIAQYRSTDTAQTGRIIAMCSVVATLSGGVIAGIIFFAAPYLADHTINAPHLTMELRIGCGLLFFNAVIGAQTGVLAGFEAFKTIAKVNLFRGLANFPLMVLGVYLFGLPGAVGGRVAAAGIGWILNEIALRMESRRAGVLISYSDILAELPILWSFSVPAFLSQAMVGPMMWGTRALLVNQDNGYSEMGIFAAAQRLILVIIALPNLVSRVSLPILSELYGTNRRKKYGRTLLMLVWLYAACCLAVMIPMSVFSRQIMFLFGKEFVQGWPILCILGLATSVSVVNMVVGQAISSSGKMWWGFFLNVLWALELLICTKIFITRGAIGLSLAYLLAYILHTAQVSAFVLKILKKDLTLKNEKYMATIRTRNSQL